MFVSSESEIWQKITGQNIRTDLYHLAGYAELDAQLTGGRAIAWVNEIKGNRLIIPLKERSVNDTSSFYDLSSPYGYPGILSDFQLNASMAAQALTLFNKEAADEGYLSSFIRLNPFLNQWHLPFTKFCKQNYHGHTVSINLDYAQMNGFHFCENHRRNIRKLEDDGYKTLINWQGYFHDFIRAYHQTMRRRHAGSYYFFKADYFKQLHDIAQRNILFIAVLNKTGEFAAGGIFTVFGDIMQYHLGATTDKEVKNSPSKLMILAAMHEGIKRGASVLHLGGGLGASSSDGVYRFKEGFATTRHDFNCLHFIHRPEIYELIKSRYSKETNGMDKNFFPHYRTV